MGVGNEKYLSGTKRNLEVVSDQEKIKGVVKLIVDNVYLSNDNRYWDINIKVIRGAAELIRDGKPSQGHNLGYDYLDYVDVRNFVIENLISFSYFGITCHVGDLIKYNNLYLQKKR